jgi:uncharacterized protein involved in high-affinity Fe2+ transport
MSKRVRAVLVFLAAVAVAAGGALAAVATGDGATARVQTTTGMAGMAGMKSKSSTTPMAMPIKVLSTTTWQGMKIQARSMAPATFVIFNGTKERVVKPTAKDDLHLMVVLSDVHTGARIPYASVWATIRRNGKIVYDERQWPMLSRYMGTHYGNNVALPGNGTYRLTLLISPPQAARHMEYAKVWLKPHRVTMTFRWNGM